MAWADRFWSAAKLIGIVALAGFFILELVRECLDDGVRLRPVIVKVVTADDAPTSELATQQILTYLNLMQDAGASEWRQLRVTDSAISSQSLSDISIQIPGSSFTLGSVVREVASFLPNRHRTLIVSITPGLKAATPGSKAADYEAALTISFGRETKYATCRSGDKPDLGYDRAKALDAMFSCLALEAMKSIDILYAAAYVQSVESKKCDDFRQGQPTDDVAAVDDYVERLRRSCGFDRTREFVATIITRGSEEEVRWISYFIGKLRRARAAALWRDEQARLRELDAHVFELDRAIARYGQLSDVDGGPTLAISMNALVDKAVSLHEFAALSGWGTDESKRRLDAAVAVLTQADKQLTRIKAWYSPICLVKDMTSFEKWTPEVGNLQKSPDGVTLVPMLQGLIKYRLWMIANDRYVNNITSRTPEEERTIEDAQLREAVNKFAVAYCAGRRTNELFMNWGNALLALRDFDSGVDMFRRAADLSPTDDGPFLNIALAQLRKVSNDGPGVDAQTQLEAMRAVADHLSWASTGGRGTPYSRLTAEIRKALGWPKDDQELEPFNTCLDKHAPYTSQEQEAKDTQHHLQRAQLKICVDAARDRLAARVPGAYMLNR